ncbi:MAG: hypothetical protein ABEJ40_08970 [Haloarculaceae archaeon]
MAGDGRASEGPSRREYLSWLGLGGTTLLAGCPTSGDTDDAGTAGVEPTTPRETDAPVAASPTTRERRTPTSTPTPDPELHAEMTVTPETVALPAIWTEDRDLEDVLVTVEVSARAQNTELASGELAATSEGSEVMREFDLGGTEWTETLTVAPGKLVAGENTFRLTVTGADGSIFDITRAPVTKRVPDEYKIDFVFGRNQQLRQKIREDKDEPENYVQNHGGTVTEDPVITNYQTPEQLSYSEKPIDLAALEYWHDNDFPDVSEHPQEVRDFFNSIDKPDEYREAKETAPYMYPNGSIEKNDRGHFDYQKFSNSNSVDEALDWIQNYLFSWEHDFSDQGPISTEDEQYAAVLQESLDRHTDVKSHFWAFDLPEAARSTHGNGLVYDQTNNELRVMETIGGPTTQTSEGLRNGDPQYHPLVEESNYLNPEHEAYREWWHPLRFAEEYRSDDKNVGGQHPLEFKTGKLFAAEVLLGVGTGDDMLDEFNDERNVALSTEYTANCISMMRNWNNVNYDNSLFEEIKNQSKVINKLGTVENENFVIYGTVDDPQYARVDNRSIVDEVWSDSEGRFDDFDRFLEGEMAA